jgi:hypothetical protein
MSTRYQLDITVISTRYHGDINSVDIELISGCGRAGVLKGRARPRQRGTRPLDLCGPPPRVFVRSLWPQKVFLRVPTPRGALA